MKCGRHGGIKKNELFVYVEANHFLCVDTRVRRGLGRYGNWSMRWRERVLAESRVHWKNGSGRSGRWRNRMCGLSTLTFRATSIIGRGIGFRCRPFAPAQYGGEARIQQTRDVVFDPTHGLFVCGRASNRAGDVRSPRERWIRSGEIGVRVRGPCKLIRLNLRAQVFKRFSEVRRCGVDRGDAIEREGGQDEDDMGRCDCVGVSVG